VTSLSRFFLGVVFRSSGSGRVGDLLSYFTHLDRTSSRDLTHPHYLPLVNSTPDFIPSGGL
jgi:hypothetical protein